MNDDIGERILQELKEHNPKKALRPMIVGLCVFLLLASGSIVWEEFKPVPKTTASWTEVNRMLDNGDLQQALDMAQALVKKTPKAHRANASLGSIYLAMGNTKEAATCYAQAHECFPASEYSDILRTLKSSKIVIADGELPTNTILTTNNIALKTCPNTEINDDGVSPNEYYVLLGHRLVVPRKQFDPIRWHDTDIVLTNRDSREQSPANSMPGAESRQELQGR